VTSFSGYRITAQAIQLCRKVVTLPAAGAYVGEPVVEESTGDTYEWSGAVWTAKGKAAPSSSGGGTATTVEVDLGSAPTFRGKFTITDAAISSTSKVLCWQAPGPYTGKGTRADEAEMQPVQIIAVEPAAGSAVVKWQTPPMIAAVPMVPSGRRDVAIVDELAQRAARARRIGRVRKNVKFSYQVL
jgi:hypothetical protein